MALLTATRGSLVGVALTDRAVSASDTIASADLGTNGAWLVVRNGGGSSDTVAISDGSASGAGNAATPSGGAVANAANGVFFISPKAVNLATLVVTVTHSFITSVTYDLFPLG